MCNKLLLGYQESVILKQLTTREELQPLAMNKILVWHTRTEKSKNDNELKYLKLIPDK